jgi:hypothetical protein
MASGSLEFLEDGAWTKRMHPGWAGVVGITAATLAKHSVAKRVGDELAARSGSSRDKSIRLR